MTTNVVSFTRLTPGYDGVERTSMIFNIQPVTDLVTFAINWQWFAIERIQDDQRISFRK